MLFNFLTFFLLCIIVLFGSIHPNRIQVNDPLNNGNHDINNHPPSPPPIQEQERLRNEYAKLLEENQKLSNEELQRRAHQEILSRVDEAFVEFEPKVIPQSYNPHPVDNSIEGNLCKAIYSLDISKVKDIIESNNIKLDSIKDSNNNPLSCLVSHFGKLKAAISIAMLQQREFNFHSYLSNKLELKDISIVNTTAIMQLMESDVVVLAKYLISNGANIMMEDEDKHIITHFAAANGYYSLLKYILEELDISVITKEMLLNWKDIYDRTPLHFAASQGNIKVLQLLYNNGGSLDVQDKFGVSPRTIISSPGSIRPEDALDIFNIHQRIPRTITRESQSSGGWDTSMLDINDDSSCAFDSFHAHEITTDEIFKNYLSLNIPVVIHGLLSEESKIGYSKTNLLDKFSDYAITVEDIPYSNTFGGKSSTAMTLGEYITKMDTNDAICNGSEFPCYIFHPHSTDDQKLSSNSIISRKVFPDNEMLINSFREVDSAIYNVTHYKDARDIAINIQWTIGKQGSGAHLHLHNSAWNVLAYGLKKWILYPPSEGIVSKIQIGKFYNDIAPYTKAMYCTQQADDTIIIPEGWSHGVLNLKDSIAVAVEVKPEMWMINNRAERPHEVFSMARDISTPSFK